MSIRDDAQAIIGALRHREIGARQASFLTGPLRAVELALAASEAERFLNLLIPTPVDRDDGLALRIFGRPQELTADDEPWEYAAGVGLEDERYGQMGIAAGPFRMHIYIAIPLDDVPEVLRRLEAS